MWMVHAWSAIALSRYRVQLDAGYEVVA